MKPISAILSLALAAQGAAALATEDGRLDTLERGKYSCEMPGDAEFGRGVPAPEENFRVANASAYVADGKRGVYLKIGEMVTMTSGPRKGVRYVLKSDRYLRKLGPNGQPTGLRCIKLGG